MAEQPTCVSTLVGSIPDLRIFFAQNNGSATCDLTAYGMMPEWQNTYAQSLATPSSIPQLSIFYAASGWMGFCGRVDGARWVDLFLPPGEVYAAGGCKGGFMG